MTETNAPLDDDAALEASRMPLRQHLEELRSRLIKSTVLLMTLLVAGLFLKDFLHWVIVLPWDTARAAIAENGRDIGTLGVIKPHEQMVFAIKVSGVFAIIVGSPYYLAQAWGFIQSGLLKRERVAIHKSFPLAVGMFAVGLLFGYYVLVPMGLRFMLTFYDAEQISIQVTLSEYFSVLSALTVLMGFVFELPLLMWVVVRAGIMEASTLSSSRRMAFVVFLVFATLLTPPDPATQLLVAIPMYGLYEIGLRFADKAQRAYDEAI